MAKVLSGAVQGLISAVIVLPIASVVHAKGVEAHLNLHWWIIVTLVRWPASPWRSLGLLLGTSFEPRNIGLMFGFIILPVTFLGAPTTNGRGWLPSRSGSGTGCRRWSS